MRSLRGVSFVLGVVVVAIFLSEVVVVVLVSFEARVGRSNKVEVVSMYRG